MTTTNSVSTVQVQFVGGSTALIELGGLRLITDPTFDPPGPTADAWLNRLTPPALDVAELPHVDVALVSHDEHPDNLDTAGRRLLARVPLVLTAPQAAERLGGAARGLAPFEHVEVERPDGATLRITALPAQHGPEGAEAELGLVTGFLLSGDDVPTVYVSGDNASVAVVGDIVARVGSVDVAVLFAGGVRVPHLMNGAPLTLTAEAAVEAARLLGARAVVPIHSDGWSHYAEGSAAVSDAFAAAGLAHVLTVLPDGGTARL